MPSNPAITFGDIEQLLLLTTAYKRQGNLTASKVYLDAKIPFMFDYRDNDAEVMPGRVLVQAGGAHGTHVAGIIAGNNDIIKGAAYNAQIIPMKIFGDDGSGAFDTDIIAAVEDSIILGVDVISMSLGRTTGFTYEYSYAYANRLYALAEDLGVIVNAATGNDSSAYMYSDLLKSFNKSDNPDNGVISCPASYLPNFATGSVDNVIDVVLDFNGTGITAYNSSNSEGFLYDFLDILSEDKAELPFVSIDGYGISDDYSGINVTGKIIVIKRGEISFEDKQRIAASKGAVGCIIRNNEEGIIRAQIPSLDIPTITVSKADGEMLANAAVGSVSIDKHDIRLYCSYFSSMGALEDLSIGVDICGVGGNVYSAVTALNDTLFGTNGYAWKSGTSMATPNTSAIIAVLMGALNEKYPDKTSAEIRQMIFRLLMSTALIVTDENDNPITPRQQGAGLADLKAAIDSPAYLSVSGSDRTKLNLGSDTQKDGVYTLTFNLVNLSDRALSYDVSTLTFTETVYNNTYVWDNSRESDYTAIAQRAHMFEGTDVRIGAVNGSIVGNTVTVGANQTATLRIVIVLSDEHKQYMDETFANGIYVEGFAVLNGENKLSIPWISFYGDWDRLPIFDSTPFNDEFPTWNYFAIQYMQYTDVGSGILGRSYVAGTYSRFLIPEGWKKPAANKDAIAVSFGIDEEGKHYGTELYAIRIASLRNLSELRIQMTDAATGEVYSDVTFNNISKYSSSYDLTLKYSDMFPVLNLWANNMTFNIVITGTFNGVYSETEVFPLTIDLEAPTLNKASIEYDGDKTYLNLNVFDNNVLQATGLLTSDGKGGLARMVNGNVLPAYDFAKNSDNAFRIDITEYKEQICNGVLAIELIDYADNSQIYEIELPDELLSEELLDSVAYYTTDCDEYIIDFENDIRCVSNTTYSFNGVGDKISAQAESAEEFVIENGVLVSYNGNGGDVIVPNGVTKTAKNVFWENADITSITFPEGFTTMGEYSCSRLVNLKKIVLPASFSTMTKYNIYACPNLESINLEDTDLSSVGIRCFMGLTKMKEMTFPDASKPLTMRSSLIVVYNLNKITFLGEIGSITSSLLFITDLTTVEFCKKVQNIDAYSGDGDSFRELNKLENIIFKDDVEQLGHSYYTDMGFYIDQDHSSGFQLLPVLKSVEFYGNINIIGGNTFVNCPSLENVVFHGDLGEIGERCFGNSMALKHFSISDDNAYLFKDEYNVVYDTEKTEIFIPNGWDYEGKYIMPESVTTLKEYQFSFPSMISKFGSASCSISEDGEPLYAMATSYVSPTGLKTGLSGVELPEGITAIPAYCFARNINLAELNYENIAIFGQYSLQYTGFTALNFTRSGVHFNERVWNYCPKLKEITFPEAMSAKSYTYFYCGLASLEEIIVPACINIATSGLFMDCTSLKKVTYSNTIGKNLGMYAFRNCTLLESVIGIENATGIGYGAFENCSSITELHLPMIKTVGNYGFKECRSMTVCEWGDDLNTLSTQAFYNCTSLKKIYITKKLTKFSMSDQFFGCTGLEEIAVHDDNPLYTAVNGALYNKDLTVLVKYPTASKNTEYTIPSTVELLGDYVFANAVNLQKIDVSGIKTIGNYTFTDSGITQISSTGNLVSLGAGAFANTPLRAIEIAHVKQIGYACFKGTALSEITLCTANIEILAFSDIPTLKTVRIDTMGAFSFARVFYNSNYIENIEPINTDYFQVFDNALYNESGNTLIRYFGAYNEVIIPEGVIRIDMEAFAHNPSLTNIELPSTLTVIGDKAFYECYSLRRIVFNSLRAPKLEALYRTGSRYSYANFVTEIENASDLSLQIIHSDDASYNTAIWRKYFG
ncbi:MAG: leucine-rich repeat protein [Clostridia bacterium]|nr:leucine-rich repeat protein [Clostridia bacterium]